MYYQLSARTSAEINENFLERVYLSRAFFSLCIRTWVYEKILNLKEIKKVSLI